MLSIKDRRVASRLANERLAEVDTRTMFHPPEARGVIPETPPGTDLTIFRFTNRDGKPAAIVYQGRAQKPLYFYRYNTPERREQHVQETIQTRREVLERKQQELQKKRDWKHTAKVGDVLYFTWGYEQTNAEFFQVVAVGDKTIAVRPLKQKVVESHGSYDKVRPDVNHFDGPAVKKVPQMSGTSYYVRFDHGTGRIWEGQPVSQTSAYAGH